MAEIDPSHFNDHMQGTLGALLGLRITEAGPDRVVAELTIRDELRTVGGALHGGTLMPALADTQAGRGGHRKSEPPRGRVHDHAQVQDQLLRGRPERSGASGGHAAPQRQAHPGVADAGHGRVGAALSLTTQTQMVLM